MLSITRLAVVISTFASLSNAALRCKCLAGDPCFPDELAWRTFSRSLRQPLIANQRPPGAPCYPSSLEFNAAACSFAISNEFSHDVLAADSNGLQWTNWQELITQTDVQGCPYDPTPHAVCHQGRVPSFSINVTTVSDIQHTIRFASQHNLHLVVKNTGHENLGRQFGLGSIELFMHNMQGVNFTDSFVPIGAPRFTSGSPAVTIEPGVQWGPLYALAASNNRTVVGGIGAGGSVGASGGWPLGGGHSILSHFYGLGVDNILQLTVVLPNASHVVANAFENTDLFWALRGGGGPSFGVVTSTTYKTHPNPPYTAAFYAATANTSESYLALFETFNKHHNAISDAGWSGFWPFINNTLFLTLLAQGVPPVNASSNATLENFFAESRSIPGVNVSLAISVPYPSFDNWYINNFINSSNGFGFNYTVGDMGGIRIAVSSWLIPRTLFDTNATELAKAFVNIPSGRPFMVGGGAVAAIDPDSAAAAPAWRTAITDMTLADAWNETSTPAQIQSVKQSVFEQIQPLRELGPIPTGGQYLNEPDFLEPDWQGAYWGSHYPRLLAIKKAIDPHDLFIVFKGVNSEQWDEEVVCKTV